MMKEKDYNQFDSQIIVLKKDVAEEIIESYKCFGWVVDSETQHPRYENLMEVKMTRSHFVKNKDDLQFLQVNMESDIIKRGRLKKTKHSKSTTLGITLAVIALAFIVCSALMFAKLFFINSLVLAIFAGVVGLGLAIFTPIMCKKIYQRESVVYQEKETYFSNEIDNYKLIAKELLGAKDGE